MKKLLKINAIVHYWNATYECIQTDIIESYDETIDMYWLSKSEDWFARASLYTNRKKLEESL